MSLWKMRNRCLREVSSYAWLPPMLYLCPVALAGRRKQNICFLGRALLCLTLSWSKRLPQRVEARVFACLNADLLNPLIFVLAHCHLLMDIQEAPGPGLSVIH